MKINETTLNELEDLCCMSLDEREKAEIKPKLESILDYIHIICDLDCNSPELVSPLNAVNVFREDSVRESLDRDTFLTVSPEHDGEMPIVPKVVE